MWQVSVPLSPSHHISIQCLCVSRGSRHHTIKKSKGAAKAVPTLNFFLFLRDPKCLPWDHRALRKPAVETPVNATTGSSFRATPTYLPTVEMSLRFGPPHKLPAHARTCLYLCRSKYWHTQRLTVTGADAVDSEFLKAFFCFMHMHKVNISVLLRALYLPDGVPQQAWVCYYYCRGTKSN